MPLTLFNTAVGIILAILLAVYWIRFRGHPKEIYNPLVSWIRAGIFFCICFLISWVTGTMSGLLHSPVATPEQLHSPSWIAWTAGCFTFIFIAYWLVWTRWTLTFDRKPYPAPQVFFGIIWGLSIGQIFILFWHLTAFAGLTLLGRWILAFMLMSLQGLWQDLYWDVYVVPEHDTPFSLKWKTICCHVPNMVLCLTYLALYNNELIFVLLQTFALTGASLFMRFPPFWVKEYIHPPRTTPGLFGLPHAAGYVAKKPSHQQ